MLPTLKLFAGGAKRVADCVPILRDQLGLTAEETEELIPSGTSTVLASRTHWARTYLSKAGLLYSPKRNEHVITERGKQVLATNPARIDNTMLNQFGEFSEWLVQSRTEQPKPQYEQAPVPEKQTPATNPYAPASAGPPLPTKQTPEDAIATASSILNATLRDELLALLQDVTPQRFERLILQLLSAMGYGGGDLAAGSLTKNSSDGGIDGIINEDALGLDAVFIQAKRYAPDSKISRPDIQRFVGSLTGEGATKGVFVTTSDFSREARDYIHRVQQRIVLINGQMLAQLLIDNGVGVRERAVYSIRSVDEDFFADMVGQ